jgi:hypothetical protein
MQAQSPPVDIHHEAQLIRHFQRRFGRGGDERSGLVVEMNWICVFIQQEFPAWFHVYIQTMIPDPISIIYSVLPPSISPTSSLTRSTLIPDINSHSHPFRKEYRGSWMVDWGCWPRIYISVRGAIPDRPPIPRPYLVHDRHHPITFLMRQSIHIWV